jgi:oligopeptide/dipeptide ABC transporter ATP-binding protein
MKNLLEIKGLRTYYFTSKGSIKAVDDATLEINEREIVGLIGESGCGKSTIALSILRLVPSPPAKIVGGSIFFKGSNLLELKEENMRKLRGDEISMIFQDPLTYLNPVIKIGDQIVDGVLAHSNESINYAKEKSINLLERVQMPSPKRVANCYPHELSGGMRQRVLIATAISCNPNLIVADEPTTALDVTVQAQVLNLMKKIVRQLRSSMLFITHDFGILAELCDRIYVMYAGKIVEFGDVFQIYENSKHPYTQGLLRLVKSFETCRNKLPIIRGTIPDLSRIPKGCSFHPRCQQSKALCKKLEPNLIEVESGHNVACWLYG